ncbi:MAG: hypothetical protein LBF22_12445 [Deltaproteobacteria bacterium]|nr:hypothetical protein [Deltaproteobacteria bacterium]
MDLHPSKPTLWRWYALKFLGLIAILLWEGTPLYSQENVVDLFLRLPDSEVNGLNYADRRELVDRIGTAMGYSSPTRAGYWLELSPPNVLTLYGIHNQPLVLKLYAGKQGYPDLLVICRSRQNSGPSTALEKNPDPPFLDLILYQKGANLDLIQVQTEDFIPPIGVFDFVTADTLRDARAVRDLTIINENFGKCLTCHASTQDKVALDIFTVTSINAHSCAGYLAQFKLLPLVWNGEYFEKPYDRGVSPDQPWPRRQTPSRGLYYNPPETQ